MLTFLDIVSSASPKNPSEWNTGTMELTAFLSFLLVRHPEAMKKLRQEIASLDTQGEPINRTHLKSLSYLQNVLKESKAANLKAVAKLTRGNQLSVYIHRYLSTPAQH